LQTNPVGQTLSTLSPNLSTAIQSGASKISAIKGGATTTPTSGAQTLAKKTNTNINTTQTKAPLGINTTQATKMGTINQTTQTKPLSNINQTKFTDAQKKDYTTINNTRTGVDDEPSDTSTKGILIQADKLGLKGDTRRAYVAEQMAKNANANKSVIQKQNELVDKRADVAEENMASDTERINKDEETLLATKAKNKEIADKYFSDIESQEQSYFAEYEAEQNRLLAEGEGTQLNQVRSQIYQALAARGIDISRIPPEQLIALSGEIGTRAFSNIFQMKE